MTGLDIELALDRLEAALATELPPYLRAAAAAYAAGTPAPPPPPVLARERTQRLVAHASPALRELVAPFAPAVLAVRAAAASPPAWADLAALARARGVAARRVSIPPIATASPPGWREPDGAAIAPIETVWAALAARHGARGEVRFLVSAAARPRAFLVEPGREIHCVIGPLTTPVARFEALHELGHAIGSLVAGGPLPRAVDEGVAAYIARDVEVPGGWYSPLAAAARGRRLEVARHLAAIEAALPELPSPLPAPHPPWALWHDPGAQAAYVEAEAVADRLAAAVPALGLARAIAAEVARIA